MAESPEWKDAAEFYLSGIERTDHEIKTICSRDLEFVDRLKTVSNWLSNKENLNNTAGGSRALLVRLFPRSQFSPNTLE